MMDRTMQITGVESCKSTTLLPVHSTWEEMLTLLSGACLRHGELSLKDYIAASDEQRKAEKDGAAWIPCSVLDEAGRRIQANMHEAHLLVLDIDSGMSLEDVKSRLSGLEAAIHSSYSHTLEQPKWRVVMPLKEEIPANHLGELFDHFQARFDGLLDPACGHDPARLYYLPACPSDAESLFVFEHLTGEVLDAKSMLEAPPAFSSAEAAPLAVGDTTMTTVGTREGSRNNEAFKRACTLFENGHSLDDTLTAMEGWNLSNEPPLELSELRKAVKSAEKHVAHKASANAELDQIVNQFNEQYAWTEKHSYVYRVAHRDFVSIEKLRQQYANTKVRVKEGDTLKWVTHADVWHRSSRRRQHLTVDFMPGKASVSEDKINQWEGWGVTAQPGDITPWNELLDHLFSGDTVMRRWFEQWLAYPLQHPGTKLTTAIVMWSIKQGVGKSMIGETMCRIYGNHGKIISAAELHGSFNNWMRATQFVLGEENSSSDRRADSNKLKVLITSEKVVINEKYQPAFESMNCANFMFTSNHADAFYLEDADRRFFVWEITADRKPDEFYAKFVDWRDNGGGSAALMDYLLKLDLTGFNPKGNAPQTTAKVEMIRQSKSDLERWLADVLEDKISITAAFGKEVAHVNEIAEVYNREQRCRSNSTAVSRALSRHAPHAKRRVVTKRGRQSLVSLINHDQWDKADNSAWQSEYNRPPPIRL